MKRNILFDKQGINYQRDQLVKRSLKLSYHLLYHEDELTDLIADLELSIEAVKYHYGISHEVSTQKKYKKRRLEKELFT